MKVVQINAVCGSGSTGKICVEVSRLLTEKGVENYIFYASGHSDYPLGRRYMNRFEVKVQALKSRLFGNYGFHSRRATKRLIAALEEIDPDIIHLHNLHGHNCDLETLFSYLKGRKSKLFWTFHDCWAFTGYCTYYDIAGCVRWRSGCKNCPQRGRFSFFFDRSHFLFEKKRNLFSNLDLTIITPSHWMAEQVKQSFLREYPVFAIHNGIDLSVFRPRKSGFREKYGCRGKCIVLGVASEWNLRKGLDVFLELAKRLDQQYKIVLVGTNAAIERRLPPNILPVRRTQNQLELAQLYSAADVFVNPTREENYPTVNLEAIACGTPVITFRTGGSAEMLDERCGLAVEKNDVDAMEKAIRRLQEDKRFRKNGCIAKAQSFHGGRCFREYVKLYDSAVKGHTIGEME